METWLNGTMRASNYEDYRNVGKSKSNPTFYPTIRHMPELELSTYLLNAKLWIHHAASAKQRIQNQGTKAHNTPKAQNTSGITTPEYPQHTKIEQSAAIQTLVCHLGRDRSL
jgi:hypothetical protein